MKVRFVMPCVGRKPGEAYPSSWMMEPLAMAQLAAMTPAGWKKEFCDDRQDTVCLDSPPDVVAINVETYTARRAYQIARQYRDKGVKVVMGGFHPTLLPEEAAAHADAVVVGEAEGLWGGLLDDAAAGRLRARYESVPRPQLGGVIPDRSLYAGRKYMGVSLVETGRGCRFNCEFCSIAGFFESTYRARPVDEVVEEIRRLNQKNIFFVDDNLCVDQVRAAELFEKLIPLRVRWMGQVNLHISRELNLLRLMRRSGCAGVLIGFESLDNSALSSMGKSMNPVSAVDRDEAIVRLTEHGLGIYATFVFGYDGDTEESFRKTLEFAIRHRFFFTAFNHLVPFPGTRLYDRLKAEGRLLKDPWWLDETYRFGDVAFRPEGLAPERLAGLCLEYRKKFYSWRSILSRGLNLRSNCRSPFMAGLFIAQNIAAARDVSGRQGLPLGLPAGGRAG